MKIYFDAIETEARVQLNKKLIEKVFHDPASVLEKYKPDAVEQLVSTGRTTLLSQGISQCHVHPVLFSFYCYCDISVFSPMSSTMVFYLNKSFNLTSICIVLS